jgi:hypothetical protein
MDEARAEALADVEQKKKISLFVCFCAAPLITSLLPKGDFV